LKNKRQDKDAKATSKADTDAAEPGGFLVLLKYNNPISTC
jgi:hypothetical protein